MAAADQQQHPMCFSLTSSPPHLHHLRIFGPGSSQRKLRSVTGP